MKLTHPFGVCSGKGKDGAIMDDFVYAKGERLLGICLLLSIVIAIRIIPWHTYGLGMKIFGGVVCVAVIWIGILIIIEVTCLCLAGFIKFLLKQ